jgi:hypothetical protein
MASGELAEWLLADVIAARLFERCVGELLAVHPCSSDCLPS